MMMFCILTAPFFFAKSLEHIASFGLFYGILPPDHGVRGGGIGVRFFEFCDCDLFM